MITRNKKLRGQAAKTKRIIGKIEKNIVFPTKKYSENYYNFLLPADQNFVNNDNLKNGNKRQIYNALLKKANDLIKNKPKEFKGSKIVVMITEPQIWDSQIIIFFNEDYYNKFFQRFNSEQVWQLISNKSFKIISGLNDFNILKEIGYHEQCFEENKLLFERNLWFYTE